MNEPRYVFLDRHQPQLKAGIYTLDARLEPTVDDAAQPASTLRVDFSIGGERFALGPDAIHSVYPPEGSRGDYARCLPHIALRRDTLPWERSADAQGTPWLALIVLDEDETRRAQLEPLTLGAYAAEFPNTKGPEPGQKDSDCLQVLHLDGPLSKWIPTRDELHALCHVRGTHERGALEDGVSVVVSKRAPVAGKNTAHLVSLEDRYGSGAFEPGRRRTVISLKSWTFYVEPKSGPSMRALFDRLDRGLLRVPDHHAAAEPYLARGRTPLAHRLRSGESGASWYSGPLLPTRDAEVNEALVKLPAASADELLFYDDQLGMFDVSYAAAWELGRLLAIERRSVAAALAGWRRAQVLDTRIERDREAHAHLPQLDRRRDQKVSSPPVLSEWLSGLQRLEEIPFKYLVPDERMLPAESLRMFSISRRWLAALFDGALSLARPPGPPRAEREAALLGALPAGPRCGFLLRSALVSGWPDLEVEAYGGAQARRTPTHRAQLSPSIALYLFDESISTLSIRQHANTVHLSLRDAEGAEAKIAAGTRGAELAIARLDRAQELELKISW